jgi:hypothetical protein
MRCAPKSIDELLAELRALRCKTPGCIWRPECDAEEYCLRCRMRANIRDAEQMRRDLLEAGWKEVANTWCSPSGVYYLGPVGAWKAMNKLRSFSGGPDPA